MKKSSEINFWKLVSVWSYNVSFRFYNQKTIINGKNDENIIQN